VYEPRADRTLRPDKSMTSFLLANAPANFPDARFHLGRRKHNDRACASCGARGGALVRLVLKPFFGSQGQGDLKLNSLHDSRTGPDPGRRCRRLLSATLPLGPRRNVTAIFFRCLVVPPKGLVPSRHWYAMPPDRDHERPSPRGRRSRRSWTL